MPAKYHINVRRVPPRFTPLARSTIIDWNEGCLRCARCVKDTCPVDAYRIKGELHEATRLGDERNYQKYLDRVQGLKDNVALHEKNVEALNKELAGIR